MACAIVLLSSPFHRERNRVLVRLSSWEVTEPGLSSSLPNSNQCWCSYNKWGRMQKSSRIVREESFGNSVRGMVVRQEWSYGLGDIQWYLQTSLSCRVLGYNWLLKGRGHGCCWDPICPICVVQIINCAVCEKSWFTGPDLERKKGGGKHTVEGWAETPGFCRFSP